MMTQMKKSAIALAVASAFWGATAVADNNDTADATVSGEVIASLGVTSSGDLVMPTLVVPDDATSASVELNCESTSSITGGSVVYGGNGNPFVNGNITDTGVHASSKNKDIGTANTGTCAEFSVTGEDGYNFLTTVSFAAPSAVITGLTFSGANCTTASTAISGATKIYCGGTITASQTASAGAYADAGTITVAVVYD